MDEIDKLIYNKKSIIYQDSPDTSGIAYEFDTVKSLMKEYVIQVLNKHIEHPTKPGYKRHDILDKIKEINKL